MQYAQRLAVEGAGDAVDDETRRRSRVDRRFAPAFRGRVRRIRRGPAGGKAADDLDERQSRRGVEKMHADAARRVPELGSNRRDREGGGVGGEDGPGADDVFKPGEELSFGLEVFDYRFDNKTGAAQIVQCFGDGQPG